MWSRETVDSPPGGFGINPGITWVRPVNRTRLRRPSSSTPSWLTCPTSRRWRTACWASSTTSTQGNYRRLVVWNSSLGGKVTTSCMLSVSVCISIQVTSAQSTRWSMWGRCRRSWPACTLTSTVRWTKCLKTRGRWHATPTWTSYFSM